MNRRTKGVLIFGGLAILAAVATIVVLTQALAKVVDPHDHCDSGFSVLINCTYHVSTKSTHQSDPIFTTSSNATSTIPSDARETDRIISVDAMSWAVADCPRNYLARRLLCSTPSDATPAQAADDDFVTGLPRPKPWFLTTAKDSMFIKAFHVETPLDHLSVLRFYRLELSKRGWSENDGAIVGPDVAVIAFMTTDGPALLRLARQGDRTIADLSLHKPATTDAVILPMPGQMKLLLGNSTDDEAIIAINEQTIELAAHTELADLATRRKPTEPQEINLPPGRYKISLRVASSAAQNREFEVAAGETWGLVAGPTGVPLLLHLY